MHFFYYKNLLLFSFLLFLVSCANEEKDQFEGNWEAFEYTVNGMNELESQSVFLYLEENGKFLQVFDMGQSKREEPGIWGMDTGKKIFTLTYDKTGQTVTWDIVEFESDEMHLTNSETQGFFIQLKIRRN